MIILKLILIHLKENGTTVKIKFILLAKLTDEKCVKFYVYPRTIVGQKMHAFTTASNRPICTFRQKSAE